MSNAAIIWTFAGVLAAASFARGLALRDKRALAELVWYTLGAFFLVGAALLWVSLETDMQSQHRIVLGVVGAIFGALAALALGEFMHGTKAQTPSLAPATNSVPQVNITGADNVVSVGQIGGITARVVTVSPPIQPELRILGRTETASPNGTHTVKIDTEVAAPFAPGLLVVQIKADGLQNVSVMPPAEGGFSSIQLKNVRKSDNFYSAEIPSPRGHYIISVTTAKATEIGLVATF